MEQLKRLEYQDRPPPLPGVAGAKNQVGRPRLIARQETGGRGHAARPEHPDQPDLDPPMPLDPDPASAVDGFPKPLGEGSGAPGWTTGSSSSW